MTITYRVMDRRPPLPADLVQLLRDVDTATIGHFEHLGFAGENIRPVFVARAIGAALTVAAPGRDGTVIYRAVDMLLPGDILVISRVDRDDIACVGGGVVSAAKARGAVGIVIDGPCTDLEEIATIGLPVWCRGVSAKTTNRDIAVGGSINVPVACGGAAVLPGYAVLADNDGVFIADADHMRVLAELAIARQQRSLELRPHLESGQSIFTFRPEAA
ncbi:RraA family protein [Rhizobium sp. BK251]|uniref:RraA family protein n=1 Tax=Rhizobium sp. BK251 TaxID=2512125 RepID=UPI0010452808|nr:RraA family protein [Rhizobium sp. BK251]TCL63638.1 regulator of RNase E activity RraA [Rhizobium sp. BK251]